MTVFAVSRASPPGMDPIPVAGHPLNLLFSLTPEAYGPGAAGTVPAGRPCGGRCAGPSAEGPGEGPVSVLGGPSGR
ncbi:hypothetical protein Sfulv_43590 [Streptomyces fulvorobeus]|uniref:Uncharacterized protein n=1 Tax=Streptomyces fulvorobeus TaxID=284028 RepID=A0A7J0CAX6_9ACTN|nr:hypothetical protein Sfulv_43590 [Streptomyces fulvorobeus]